MGLNLYSETVLYILYTLVNQLTLDQLKTIIEFLKCQFLSIIFTITDKVTVVKIYLRSYNIYIPSRYSRININYCLTRSILKMLYKSS